MYTNKLLSCSLLATSLLLPVATLAIVPDASQPKLAQVEATKLKPVPRFPAHKGRKPQDSIEVRIVGTLRTGIAAIGGETTGTTITAKGITWELEFARNARLRDAAARLDGKRVMVRGSLDRRPGVEIKERWIVTVTDLRPDEDLGRGTSRPR